MLQNSIHYLFPHGLADELQTQLMPIPTDVVIKDDNIVDEVVAYLQRISIKGSVAVVTDSNTYKCLGEELIQKLKTNFNVHSICFAGNPKADMSQVIWLEEQSQKDSILMAVGSGTINDLCKYVSYRNNKSYMVCPTAPSMNGYISANASIIKAGYRSSCTAHLPQMVFVDLSILKEAPLRLIQSGFGDMLARRTAQADWLLSHYLLDTVYSQLAFDIVVLEEAYLFAHAEYLIERDSGIILSLMRLLLISGLSMVIARGSFPASQGEHMIAHTMEMIFGVRESFHGEQIAITTLHMLRLQHQWTSKQPTIQLPNISGLPLVGLISEGVVEECKNAMKKKFASEEKIRAIDVKRRKHWVDIQKQLKQICFNEEQLLALCKAVNLSLEPSSVGWSDADYRLATNIAWMTRDRFTFLDIEAMQ